MPRSNENQKKDGNRKKKQESAFTRPKGMRDIIGDAFYAYQGFFEKASETALYYGFSPIHTPLLEREALFANGVGEGTDIVEKEMFSLKTKGGDSLVVRPEGTAPIMRAYIENGMHTQPQPVMLYYYGPYARHEQPQRGRWREFFQFGLEVIGSEKSITDAMIIRIATLILQESGFKNLCVLINSIGDRDSRAHYVKELTAYYRKNLSRLGAVDRQRLKTNPLRILDSKDPRTQEVNEEAPESLSHLNDASRKHFREVLEYLDTMEIPYQIDHTLVRGLDYYSHTVFEIVTENEEAEREQADEEGATEATKEDVPKPLALGGGGRYNYLAEKLGSKHEISGVGFAFGVDRIITAEQYKGASPRIVKKPKVYFIQLGFEAKLKSMRVIEILRKARIPVSHSLSKDKLSIQLGIAEKLGIPHVIIMGQKEAVEDAVIVRNMHTHSQDTVPIDNLAEYLKKNT